MCLTYERRVALITVPNLEVVVVTVAFVGRRLDAERVPEVDPDEVAEVGRDRPETGDVGRIIFRIHRTVELERARIAVCEIFTIFF